MKKISLILLSTAMVLLLHVTTKAQSLQFGVKAGVNMNKLKSAGTSESGTTPMGGVYARFKLLGFFIQGEALVSQRGAKLPISTLAGTKDIKVNLTTVDVPVLFGKKFLKVLRVNAGPTYRYLLAARTDGKDSKDNFKSSVVGFQAGVGVDFWKLGVDVRYDGAFGRIDNQVTNVLAVNYLPLPKTNMGSFQVSVSYRLSKIGF